MRLNFSGVDEDAIREGIRRIGEVVREQVAMYGTLTGAGGSVEPPRREAASRADVTAAAARIAAERAAAAQRTAAAPRATEAGGDSAADRVGRTDEDLAKVLHMPAKHKRAG
jgi:hypothetical protein